MICSISDNDATYAQICVYFFLRLQKQLPGIDPI